MSLFSLRRRKGCIKAAGPSGARQALALDADISYTDFSCVNIFLFFV